MTLPHISEELRQEDSSVREPGEPPSVKTVCVSGESPQVAIHLELSWALKLHLEATAHAVGGQERQNFQGCGRQP